MKSIFTLLQTMIILGFTVCLSACIELPEEDDDETAEPGDIVGVWDYTTDEAGGTQDVYYMAVESDGDIIVYDYQGDSYDEGANCYFIYDTGFSQYVSGNRFEWTIVQSSSNEVFTVTVSGDNLTIAGGDVLTRTSLLASDFSPEC